MGFRVWGLGSALNLKPCTLNPAKPCTLNPASTGCLGCDWPVPLQLIQGGGVAVKPGVPVLGFGGFAEALDDVGVGGEPGFPVVGGGGGDRLDTSIACRTDGPALGDAKAVGALVTARFINPDLGTIHRDRRSGAGGETSLATDTVRGDGVSHGD